MILIKWVAAASPMFSMLSPPHHFGAPSARGGGLKTPILFTGHVARKQLETCASVPELGPGGNRKTNSTQTSNTKCQKPDAQ